MSVQVGVLCYFACPKRSWTLGNVESIDEKKKTVTCKAHNGGDKVAGLKDEEIMVTREDLLDENVDDLLHLTLLHDATILAVLKKRYLEDIIYTNIGAIVVALNPFNFKIPRYMDDQMPKYLAEGDRIEQNSPHSWAVAHNTYWEMMNDQCNQCILVSGESGAGKTEASKIVMKYLAALSCKSGTDTQKAAAAEVGTKINKSSPPLETYGNARTVRNDNSSRFGKFMKVKFDSQGFLLGAHITKYLLEKSRIVTASKGERVYHSFYMLLRSSEYKNSLLLKDQKSYKSVSAGKQWDNKEFNSSEEFTEVIEAMATIGIDPASIDGMWSVVGGILHILNVDFEEDGEGSLIKSDSLESVDITTDLWKIDKTKMEREMVSSELDIGGQKIVKLLPPIKAIDSRDAMVKAMYDAEFGWLVEKCNEMLDVENEGNWIGLLDIFGFEDFEVNSFEQFCINLANETLQGHYNQFIFSRDMAECRAEGIDVADVEFPDNSPCLVMMVSKGSISALLDEECSLGKGSDLGFLDKITDAHGSNPFFLKKQLSKSSFIIHHYAGSVSYEVDNFLEKNRDTLKDAIKLLMRGSEIPFIAGLLPAPVEKSGPKLTVGGFFKSQLKELMDVINSTNPHWIRCVKPHPAKKPLMIDGVSTMHQLSSAGVLGTVKIRKAGFPVRIRFEDFILRYGIIAEGVTLSDDPKTAAEQIVSASGIDPMRAQTGKTRAFLKSDAYVDLEQLKRDKLQKHARVAQAFARAIKPIDLVKHQVYEQNKALVESLRVVVKAMMAHDKHEVEGRNAIEEEENAEWKEALATFHSATREIDHDRIVALEMAFEDQLATEREELEEAWFDQGIALVEDEERLRSGLYNIIQTQIARAKREEQLRMMKKAEEASKRAHEAKLSERKARAESVRASKELRMSKIKNNVSKEQERAKNAEDRRLQGLQSKTRLGGGKVLSEEEKDRRDKREWEKAEAVRKKALLDSYSRQTWEEMKLADVEYEKTEILQEKKEKARQKESVLVQRVQDRKVFEAKRKKIEDEENKMAREVERIRKRESVQGSKLVREREEMRKRAEQKEWKLLQEYFANQTQHESLERRRAAEV